MRAGHAEANEPIPAPRRELAGHGDVLDSASSERLALEGSSCLCVGRSWAQAPDALAGRSAQPGRSASTDCDFIAWAFAIIASIALTLYVGARIFPQTAPLDPSWVPVVFVVWSSIEIVGTLGTSTAVPKRPSSPTNAVRKESVRAVRRGSLGAVAINADDTRRAASERHRT